MNMEKIKRYIRNHEQFMYILSFIYRWVSGNRVIGRRNLDMQCRGAFFRKSRIENRGKNNQLILEKGCRICKLKVRFFGDNNCVVIHRDCVLDNVDIWISDGSTIEVGHNTHFTGDTHIASIEGKTVHIGERCLLAEQIIFRTGDSHSVLNDCGERINPAEDIWIGDHVWIGQQVTVLKGVHIGDECVIGTRAVVTGKQFGNGELLVGMPARAVKQNITWDHRNLSVKDK